MSLIYNDHNYDGKINVIDMNEIMEHYGSAFGRSVYDVNGDGNVDNSMDIDLVSDHFDQ